MEWESILARSYVPYSGRPGACLVKGEKNKYYPGVRIENIAFPDTIDEKQAALYFCLSEGDTPRQLLLPGEESNVSELINFWKNEYHLEILFVDEIDKFSIFDKLISSDIDIGKHLVKLLDRAVVQNSNFPVSALLRTPDGFISGVNVECSEWRLGLCAERIAIAKALACGHRELLEIYIHTKYGEFSSPCGACRQVIVEHMPQKPVHLYHANGTESYHLTTHLLPYSFKSASLNKEINSD